MKAPKIDRAALLPAFPAIEVCVAASGYWKAECNRFRITYTGSRDDLRSAGIVTPLMLDKILYQRSGTMLDDLGRKFRVLHDGIHKKRRERWENAERVEIEFETHRAVAAKLPGMAWIAEEGAAPPSSSESSSGMIERTRRVGRFRRLVKWSVIDGKLIVPDWYEVRAGGAA